ncbi:unnamed protein product, partial [Larinioides sclopetarius]
VGFRIENRCSNKQKHGLILFGELVLLKLCQILSNRILFREDWHKRFTFWQWVTDEFECFGH